MDRGWIFTVTYHLIFFSFLILKLLGFVGSMGWADQGYVMKIQHEMGIRTTPPYTAPIAIPRIMPLKNSYKNQVFHSIYCKGKC